MFFQMLALLSAVAIGQDAFNAGLGDATYEKSMGEVPYILHVVPLLDFPGGTGGSNIGGAGGSISGGLIGDPSRALFGVMSFGGDPLHNCGVVYELIPEPGYSSYQEIVLHTFEAGSDGCNPFAPLAIDAKGRLFGTTYFGGGVTVAGTVFMLTPAASGYVYRVIHRFCCLGPDGANPQSPLLIDPAGALYGTTWNGGVANCASQPYAYGCGTVYKLAPTASGYSETVIYRFTGKNDGSNPEGPLIMDRGALYGTNEYGGDLSITFGVGTAFKLSRSGLGYKETTLHVFGMNDGNAGRPNALVADRTGTLYGTAAYGGGGSGNGVIFELARSKGTYVYRTLHAFNGRGGSIPFSPLTLQSGILYGTTYGGGMSLCFGGCGVAFSFAPSPGLYHVLYRFDGGILGSSPSGSLLLSGNALYGTTVFGGSTGNGAAYELEL